MLGKKSHIGDGTASPHLVGFFDYIRHYAMMLGRDALEAYHIIAPRNSAMRTDCVWNGQSLAMTA